MTTPVMLVPNPNRAMHVERVIVISESEDKQRVSVLSVEALGKDPILMRPYGSGYAWATASFGYFGAIVLIVGIILSFAWHWWIFILGFFAAAVIFRSTREGTADFAAKIIANNPGAVDDFARKGLIWEVPLSTVIPEQK